MNLDYIIRIILDLYDREACNVCACVCVCGRMPHVWAHGLGLCVQACVGAGVCVAACAC